MLIHMIRKQVYIDDDLDQGLKSLAETTGQAEAVHVRAALRAYLDAERPPVNENEDPLLRLIGLVDDPEGPDDVAEQHDHYLYGVAKEA